MNLFALTKTQEAGGQLALAAVLGIVGLVLLLPRPRGRFVPGGIAALVAAAAVFGAWVYNTYGNPLPDLLGTVLFWLFAGGALVFGTVLVVQKNPARGAIAFAFVILSTCGLFLLLAAPFLMAATIIIYAGAIIVTFLFVLMLSHADAASNENDRSREPLYGSFAGFAFVGLVLFSLYQTSQANAPVEPGAVRRGTPLPAPVLAAEERTKLADVVTRLDAAGAQLDDAPATASERAKRVEYFEKIMNDVAHVVGQVEQNASDGTLRTRLEMKAARPARADEPGEPAVLFREDTQARNALKQAAKVRTANFTVRRLELAFPAPPGALDTASVKAQARALRDEVAILYGTGDLPADNVRNLGFVLYSEHLLAIELAGTLLLVATIGAVAIAQSKRDPAGAGGDSRTQKGVAK
ncbi:NADH-quinone oxidoreductase subunit J [Frigoriglobus tundricola]|uniref:NADH-quinone oxidoreductase subunit J n=1 Tax=Frigoriglobus tundricola TaxID=2774151 RepID=A0A6M5YL11_9BACT|nr:NADH-quinone oxidoreductase subunit J [Frigoriglobus tundricola]QJW93973.1 hypothetical protein FTUN_1490 [Frigoriglobus tundricola]